MPFPADSPPVTLSVRPLARDEILAGPHWRLRCPALHPFGVGLLAARLGWTAEDVEQVLLGGRQVVIASEEPARVGRVVASDLAALEGDDQADSGTDALVAVLAARGVTLPRPETAPCWPILHLVALPPDAFRRRWHGLNVLYARLSRDVELISRVALESVPAYLRAGLERQVEHLFVNGRRDRTVTARAADGEAPTLSRAQGWHGEAACTSLEDVLRECAAGLDPVDAFTSRQPVLLQAASDHVELACDALRAIGLHAMRDG